MCGAYGHEQASIPETAVNVMSGFLLFAFIICVLNVYEKSKVETDLKSPLKCDS